MMKITRRGNKWFVTQNDLRVSPECDTEGQARAWLDKLIQQGKDKRPGQRS